MAISYQKRFVGKGERSRWRHTATVRLNGHSVSKTFATEREANRWAISVEKDIETGAYRPPDAKDEMTLAEAIGEWLPLRVEAAKGDGKKEQYMGEWWERQPLAKRRMLDLRSGDFAQWRDAALKDGASPSTVRNKLNFLSPLFEKARVEWGLPIPHPNPIQDCAKPKLDEDDERSRRLHAGEYEVLLDAAAGCGWPLLRPMIVLAVNMAWRQGELRALRWDWIDLHSRVAMLPKHVGKTREIRATPLTQEAHKALSEMDATGAGKLVFGDTTTDSVTYWFDKARKAVREVGKKEDKPWGVDLRFHDLRHEACSLLFERGYDGVRLDSMQISKHFSGHKTLAMLARYTHFPEASRLVEIAALCSKHT